MAALITNDLRRVLDARNPERVDVLIEAESGKGDAAADALEDAGVTFSEVSVRNKSVFEATITQPQLSTIQQSDAIATIDHSPTFAPTGTAAPPLPGRGEATRGPNASRKDLYQATEALGFPEAWEETGVRGEGVKIGMVDTPIDQSHPSLDDKVAGTAGPGGDANHGTWVASAMVAEEYESSRGTIRGGAPGAELYAHGALGGGGASLGEIAEGINYLLANDVDVINLSLGGPHSEVFHSIIQEARNEGALVVSSAGNSGPASGTITCPAHHEETVSVGSVATSGEPASFSSRGPGNYESVREPDVMAFGGSTTSKDGGLQITEAILGAGAGGGDIYLLGTSMASPQVAAMAALRVSAKRAQGQ